MWLLVPVACAGLAQEPPRVEEPPEEDETIAAREYSFNPLQAAKELKVGNFYFKKGNYRAAALRFEEAAKWDSGFADAYQRWGEALEKQDDAKGAVAAYRKYLAVAPDARNAGEIRKRIEKLTPRK